MNKMVKAPMDVYMQTLAGYIHDEDKLVTYKWLSKELEVHVNTAKELLAEYWEKHKNDGIVATVMLIGNTKDGGMRVEVVKESDLEEASKKYDKILSQHLYSLQKTLTDIGALANAGKGDSKFSAIKCKESVLLSDEELFSRRWGSSIQYQERFDEKTYVAPPVRGHETVNPLKKAFANAKPSESKDNEKLKENETETKTETKKTSPQNQIFSYSKILKDHKKAPKKPVQSTKTGFSALFGKVQNQTKSPTNGNVQKPVEASNTKEDDEMDVDFVLDEDEVLKHEKKAEVEKTVEKEASAEEKKSSPVEEKKSPIAEEKKSPALKEKKAEEKKSITNSGKSGKKNTNRGKKRGRSQESQDESKKRKRIVVVSDSSESEEEREEETDPFGTSITEEPIEKPKLPSPPPVQRIDGKRKVRKMVDKTFVDEDGFMVTKKVQVLESASEDDEPAEPTTEKEKSPIKNAEISKAKKPNKQTSIMNFFKKV